MNAASLCTLVTLVGLLAAAAKPAPTTAAKATNAAKMNDAAALVDDGKGPKRRTISLDAKRAKAVYKVNAAPGLATMIEMPEAWARTPTCGDCVFGDAKPEGQLWRLDVFPETRSLSIKPTRLPGADAPASGFVTNIDVELEGGIAVTLFVELAVPEQADARVEFSLSEADKAEAKLSKRERELEEKFDERVKRASTDAVLVAAMKGTTCKDFWGRPNRSDDVVVRMKQLCKNASLVYVTFEIENRHRDDVHLSGALLESTRPRAPAGDKIERDVLRFNERGLGIAALPADGDAPERYRLTVTAEGIDQPTRVVVDDIQF